MAGGGDLSIDTLAVIGAAGRLAEVASGESRCRPLTPNVHHAGATQAIGELLNAFFGVQSVAGEGIGAAATTISTAALDVAGADLPGWMPWPG
jgi:hypothetical protein